MYSDGGRPIWNDVLMIVQGEVVKTSQKAAKKQMLDQFKSLLMLQKVSTWENIGSPVLAGSFFSTLAIPKDKQSLSLTLKHISKVV